MSQKGQVHLTLARNLVYVTLPGMPRRPRCAPGGLVYHVLNRANARTAIFADEGDYAAFERILREALQRWPVELFTWCVMPNHWHLVLRPGEDGQISQFMRWLTLTHTHRWHAHRHTAGSGHLYQGRFKSFPVETDEHFLTVCRYVERNALRAGLTPAAQEWRWGALWRRYHQQGCAVLAEWPVPEPVDWVARVNRPQSVAEQEAMERCIRKGRPFGSEQFEQWTADALGLDSAFRERGQKKAREDVKCT